MSLADDKMRETAMQRSRFETKDKLESETCQKREKDPFILNQVIVA